MAEPVAATVDRLRGRAGFLPVDAVAGLADDGVLVLDPFSTLVSPGVALAAGVTLWPGTILQATGDGRIAIGAETQLFPGTRIVAAGGRVSVGTMAEIGEEGGFTIKADQPGNLVEIGSGARLLGGGSLTLCNSIGDGAQVLGPIRMQNCRLQAGGSHREPDPDRRGGVLKGSGVARGLTVPTGMVIQAFGLFSEDDLRPQTFFHPKPRE
ncbi:hypothetical protein [Azospirillum picis]|uniref:Carbonic anhydrase/acetyltransferase-like protein (Isoleucine patch superfamily) n=1 Tax=Azospirillum picis TaxID=488438 RepID=A0ABU0MJH0_9PROT|nr:hypothetical protein [Azospirillum picis]MBP2299809.1 carbonic anhydrase/acetyltransferase-like protein (isoleucine patch superfamily) [Azospirillum picis]MDQ0533605.1 carbonic anhydrase/acetyltransferase-like protein (isoleucine patch superfamily) [Azospirillum picis]